MSEFHKVISLSNLSENQLELCEVDDRLVILVRKGSDVYCIDDVCTHDGGTLSDGELAECLISCPRHGAKFDIRDGRAVTMPATEDTVCHEVKVDGGDVYVKIVD